MLNVMVVEAWALMMAGRATRAKRTEAESMSKAMMSECICLDVPMSGMKAQGRMYDGKKE